MSVKKTIIFFIVFILLGGYYFIQVRRSERQKAEEEAAKKLFSVTENDIQEISLKRFEKEILLKKQEEIWKMVRPVSASVDTEAVKQVLSVFAGAERKKTVVEDSSQDKEFGLETPELIISAKGPENDQENRLSIGHQTPTASGYYARVGETLKVVIIENSVKTGLNKTMYDLRDKTVLDFEPAKIKKAIFTMKDPDSEETQTIELEQNEDVWKITAPQEFNADTTAMGTLLSQVKSAKIKTFVHEDPDDLAQYGLDQPAIILSLVVGEDNSRKTLFVGNAANEETDLYAKHEGAQNVFLIPSAMTGNFPKELNDLRDKTLLSFKNDDVQKIELTALDQEPIVVERESSEDWKIKAPQEFKADNVVVRRLLSDAGLLKVEQFVTDQPEDIAVYGLEPPVFSLRLWEKEQGGSQQLLLGESVETADSPEMYAKLGEQGSIVLVNAGAIQQLHKTVFELRDKKILSFDRAELQKIRIEYADITLLMEKDGDEWKTTEPEKNDLTLYKVNNLVYDLKELEFTRKLSEPEADLSFYGLKQPELKLTLWDNKGKEIATLLIGEKIEEQEERYVKLASQTLIYAIDAAFLGELPRGLADLIE